MKPYYQDDDSRITIYHGDCREILPTLPKFDLVLTDPPYGIGADRGRRGMHGGALAPSRSYADTWDVRPSRDVIDLVVAAGRDAIVWGGNYFDLPPARCWLVWDKCNGSNTYADAEMAWTTFDKPVRLKQYRWHGMIVEHMGNKEQRVHPTQKPVDVMTWAIGHAPEGTRDVLDPYMGSGSILVAAKVMDLRATGIEISEKYCEIAAKRLGQGVLAFQ